MSLAQNEVVKRKAVRAMLERLRPDTQEPVEASLHTRQELFGGNPNATEKGFQQRCLTRLCTTGLLDFLVAVPTRTRVYAVRDSNKVLDALTDDEALTRAIWHRAEVPSEEPAVAPAAASEGPETPEGGGSVALLAEMVSKSGDDLQTTTLKLLAGMVESLYYMRTKLESIEQQVESLAQGPR